MSLSSLSPWQSRIFTSTFLILHRLDKATKQKEKIEAHGVCPVRKSPKKVQEQLELTLLTVKNWQTRSWQTKMSLDEMPRSGKPVVKMLKLIMGTRRHFESECGQFWTATLFPCKVACDWWRSHSKSPKILHRVLWNHPCCCFAKYFCNGPKKAGQDT